MKQYTIREIREKFLNNISQEKVAHKMGKTVASWNRKENYMRFLTGEELINYAALAKIDPRQIKLKP